MSDLDQASMWEINRAGWNAVAQGFYGAAALPNYGPFAPSEDELGLIGDVRGRRLLEIGCGSGHSLRYLAERGAAELWGVDLSSTQIEFARALLKDDDPRLFNAPMETNPGLPSGYFDFAFSLYALGWTTDLDVTLALIYGYLKPGGFYVFSWEHPFYSCLDYQDGIYFVKERYLERTFVEENWRSVPIVMHQRQISTFVNAALSAGFQIERLVEGEANLAQPVEAHDTPDRWYSAQRAQLVPPTFIVKVRKPL